MVAEEVIGSILRVLCFVRSLSRGLSLKNRCYEIESVGDHSDVKLHLAICHCIIELVTCYKMYLLGELCLYLLKGEGFSNSISHLSLPLHSESFSFALSVPGFNTHTL